MKKFLIFLSLNILFLSKVLGAIANCSGGKCNFENSFHYEFAETYCTQNLSYEEVETNYLYFIVVQTGQRCEVFKTEKKN